MKYAIMILALSVFLPSGILVAQGTQTKAAAAQPALKITKITGTVNIMKDGMVVMTLKPGDAIPTLVDSAMTFSVVDGSIEVEAGGQKLTAATGANFTVNAEKGAEVQVSVAAGAPVEMKGTQGNTVVLAQNSDVQFNTQNGKVEIEVTKGNATLMTPSGEAPKTIAAGEKVEMAAPAAPQVQQTQQEQQPKPVEKTEPVVDNTPEPADTFVPPPPPPVEPVIQTQIIQESCEVSGSTPGCN